MSYRPTICPNCQHTEQIRTNRDRGFPMDVIDWHTKRDGTGQACPGSNQPIATT